MKQKPTRGAMSTATDYDLLILKMTELTFKQEQLETQFKMLAEMVDDEVAAQKKAIVALGGIIKGMDDRLEDLEHPVDFRDLPQ